MYKERRTLGHVTHCGPRYVMTAHVESASLCTTCQPAGKQQ